MGAYSFKDVKATIAGPGGAVIIGGLGAGVAEEGIKFEPTQDKNIMSEGADGSTMHSLIASESATVTLTLQKNAMANMLLDNMYIVQTQSAILHGRNTIIITDLAGQNLHTFINVAFKKRPAIAYAKEAGNNEWTFDAGKVITKLGPGIPDVP